MFILCGLRENEKSCKDCIFPQGEGSLIQTELYLNELLRTREQIHDNVSYFHPGYCIF